jgi:septal ring factor EnvC (AmiA/AmiB activator)
MNTFLTSVGQLLGFSAETQLSETDATAKLTTFVESQTAQIATHVATIEELNTAATTAAAKIASLEARVATQETEIQTLETQLSNVPKPAAPQTDALLSIETHKAKMEALPATHPDRIAFEAWTQAQG